MPQSKSGVYVMGKIFRGSGEIPLFSFFTDGPGQVFSCLRQVQDKYQL